jgi:hypothetical protein
MRLVLIGVTRMIGVTVIGAIAVSACDSGPSDIERTASAVCEELRAHDDRIVDLVNASVAGIATLPAGDRAEAISGGLDAVTAEVEVWQRRLDTVDLGDAEEVDELRRQLTVGAERALDELTRQRASLRSGPIPDREVQGAVGEWFNSVEKVMSVSEPEVFRLDRQEARQAFLDEPACRHVIQQFVDE